MVRQFACQRHLGDFAEFSYSRIYTVSQGECNFEMIFSQSQGNLKKRGERKAEALACVEIFQQAKPNNCQSSSPLNIVKHQVIYHSKLASIACEEKAERELRVLRMRRE
eukprot:6195792-Pleurochrysis_carterae.AAC.8